MKQVPVIICVDVEPDEHEIDINLRSPWNGFIETYKLFSKLRPLLELAAHSPVRFSWFLRMDPQIEIGYGSSTWVLDQYPEIFSDLQLKDDELGLHVHATRWDKLTSRWIGDYGNQEWVATCVKTAFNAYSKALQRSCKSVSFGDRWSNNEAIALAESLGAESFLSLEPGAKPSGSELGYQFDGEWPDYENTPTDIHRASTATGPLDQRKSDGHIWRIPLSTGKYEGSKTFRFWRVKRLAKALGIDLQRHNESTTLRLHIPPDVFRQTVEGLIRISNASYLSVVVRTDACSNPAQRSNLECNIEYLRSHSQLHGFKFTTPAETIRLLNG